LRKTGPIKNILVAVDGSKISQKAAVYAVELAKKLGTAVTLVSVIDNTPYTGRTTIPAAATPIHLTEPVEDYLRRAAAAYMAQAEKLFKNKAIPAKSVTRTGSPAEEIIKESRRSKADLIVIGSHGKSAVNAAILGSVAFGVVHRSRIPVFIVR